MKLNLKHRITSLNLQTNSKASSLDIVFLTHSRCLILKDNKQIRRYSERFKSFKTCLPSAETFRVNRHLYNTYHSKLAVAQVHIIQVNWSAFVWVKASLQKSDTRKSYGKAYIVEKCILPNKCIYKRTFLCPIVALSSIWYLSNNWTFATAWPFFPAIGILRAVQHL